MEKACQREGWGWGRLVKAPKRKRSKRSVNNDQVRTGKERPEALRDPRSAGRRVPSTSDHGVRISRRAEVVGP